MDPASPRLVLGTAGHIDHGKTALIRALTGVDTDRLPEEKARGITIDLGFAPLDLGDTRIGVVDVPGHEGLVRTMVAGAVGIDLLLLVVAADEGVMPQTREHVAICELLGLSRGVVALTKRDLVDEEMAELAAEEVRELLAPTHLADARILPVSSTTGDGIDALREALTELLALGPPRTPRQGPPRLPVDRAFEIRGFGAVATGTLIGAPLAVGASVELYPSGKTGRVRGIQNHGAMAQRGEPGARCAVNVQGIALDELHRGLVVAPPGALAPTTTLDVELTWLPVAPEVEGTAAAALLIGTAERQARIAPIGADTLAPGFRGFARIHIDGDPVVALPGDRFVLRGFARNEQGGATLGGGTVLDVAPPHRRRSDPGLAKDLQALARRDPQTDLRVRIERSGLSGVAKRDLERETGLPRAELDAGLDALHETGLATHTSDERWLAAASLDALEARFLEALARFHEREPLRPGMPTAALRGVLPDNVAPDVAALALTHLVERGRARIQSDVASLPEHNPELSGADREAADRALAVLAEAALEAPSLKDLAEKVGVGEDALRNLLAHLGREGRVVRAPGEIWFDAAAVEALRQRVRDHFATNATLETPAFKAIIGTTRRTAVPLMELLDEERLTLRRGDARRLRKGS